MAVILTQIPTEMCQITTRRKANLKISLFRLDFFFWPEPETIFRTSAILYGDNGGRGEGLCAGTNAAISRTVVLGAGGSLYYGGPIQKPHRNSSNITVI